MANEIGFSTIYPSSGLGSAGPIGATGATGADQTVRGSTGATGLDSNYITSVFVNQDTGVVEFGLSRGITQSPGILRGATGVYAGVTAFSLGSGTSILKGVCGGITLDFYNFRTDGLLGITYSTDGALVFTISANSGAGGISPYIENDRIVYAQSKTTIMSTDMIPEASNGTNRVGANNYGYVNFGGETAGRNIVADITESSLSVGPIERGEFTVNLSDFYITGVEGITLDVSRATVYNLITPLGIKAFTTNNITEIPDGQVMSVTLIVHGEDIWNFPEDVVFDAESKPIFYPGVNILHMWRTNTDEYWRASFTARGIGAQPRSDGKIENPGVRGSCCYFDVDGTKHCDDYVTQTYCTERRGNFEGLIPCDKNSCIVGEEKEFDGVCCTEGRCVSDIDPSLCQTIGGYFISGLTCGQEGLYPDDNAENYSVPGTKSGLCYNQCKTPTICCKNGTCLGQLTEAHCDYLGGITVRGANDCNSAKCCDHIIAPGACCTQTNTGAYQCTVVDTPYECNSTSGIYMGKNTTCNVDEDICCTVANQLTCYECTGLSTGICSCAPVSVNALSCEAAQLYTNPNCDDNCQTKTCHKCEGIVCNQHFAECGDDCPQGFELGPCVASETCQTKKCYARCVNNICQSSDITLELGSDTNTPCEELSTSFPNDTCDCVTVPPGNESHVACFWCFPILLDSNILMNLDSAGNRLAAEPNIGIPDPGKVGQEDPHIHQVWGGSQAPFRSVFSVSATMARELDTAAGYAEGNTTILSQPNANASTINITLPAGVNLNGYSLSRSSDMLYYDETDLSQFNYTHIGIINDPIGEVLSTRTSNNGEQERDINFRCYYVGSFEHSADKPTARDKCLARYGYAVEQRDKCLLCDPVKYRILNSLGSADPDNGIEPYQDKIRNGFYAPFPPLWGRITYTDDRGTCNSQDYSSDTYNLNLFKFSNIRSIVTAFLLKRGKYWLNEFLTGYDSRPLTGANPENKELYDGLRTVMKEELLGSLGFTPQGSIEPCVAEYSPTVPAERFNYDPYGLGGSVDYCSAYVFNSHWRCATDGFGICCSILDKGWALPAPGLYPLPLPPVPGSEAVFYYPLDAGGLSDLRIQSVGERYLRKLNLDTSTNTPYVRGIFGRNLRYNLDTFRTSTVFYHDQFDNDNNLILATTMKENPKIIIPIKSRHGWFAPGSVVSCDRCGERCGCEGDCVEDISTGFPTCLPWSPDSQTICRPWLAPDSDDVETWSADEESVIAPSTTQVGSPLTAPVQKSQIFTKSVYITPGICVDMLCPDCNSYESC